METSGGIRASLAGRYASALFDLARDERQIEAVSQSLATLKTALGESADLKALVSSPLVGRTAAAQALGATAASLGLDKLTTNFLAVLAKNGRLGQLAGIIRLFEQLAADHRGETTAEVVSARPLDDDQLAALKAQLGARVGRDIRIDARVDPAILGGLVVRLGSQMIDASIRTKLNSLATAMKG
ncbi:F0F1 ATP synthase subunit delta [Sphingomonas astaxanthinifaciens]|uniref:ATP synthase subunit delta n=1 Tax=Sphingomonas astaxanthinifaciens DSM 22298 TaxID=1123267 RepID=A0ABQ5Z4R1_9SPHN|nr:F0F1 ATP synthase subunit delta [Sphingomonas astaxanthinifaciens]GLR46640.1 ATP synthase subunit delta [Sphingomonas astaxanthinifaciens DSM 22298]